MFTCFGSRSQGLRASGDVAMLATDSGKLHGKKRESEMETGLIQWPFKSYPPTSGGVLESGAA